MTNETNQMGCGIVRDRKPQVIEIIAGRLRDRLRDGAGRCSLSDCNHCGFVDEKCGIVRARVPLYIHIPGGPSLGGLANRDFRRKKRTICSETGHARKLGGVGK